MEGGQVRASEAQVTSLHAQLDEMRSRNEVMELGARYGWHVSRAEPEAISELFTEDGVYASPGSNVVIQGRSAMVDYFRNELVAGDRIPLIVNHVIRIAGDSGEGTCKMFSPWLRGKPGLFCGWYEEQYRRVDGRWLFANRTWWTHKPPF